MKRSEALEMMKLFYGDKLDHEQVLKYMENVFQMQPPPIQAKFIRGENYPWGGGCPIRCNCDECNPNFLMNRWEQE